MNSVAVTPSAPRIPLPPGACDTHTHVFGPLDRFPLVIAGSYEPPRTPFAVHRAMLDRVGFARAILVQPAPYALDCSALLDACMHAPDRLRGIAVANSEIDEDSLHELKRQGIRGLRFVEVPDPQGGGRYRGSVGFNELKLLAPRMAAAGLHAQIWADCERIVTEAEELLSLGVPIVVDHIGKPDVARGANDPAFARLVALAAEGRIWVKLSVCRASKQFPDYEDIKPLHHALIAAAPRQLLWASDWPHVRMGALTPDVGHLVDLFDGWTGNDGELRRKIFVENPRRLYGFD
jgi:2-pyrone-4,6-dicarboxylate lactonase